MALRESGRLTNDDVFLLFVDAGGVSALTDERNKVL